MTSNGQLLPEPRRIVSVTSVDSAFPGSTEVVFTRDHDVIKRWADDRQAEPATGEASGSGPAKINVNDGGAGVRFNFPGVSAFRPISWDEWFANFDRNDCAFVYDNEPSTPASTRYRIVRADDWKSLLSEPGTNR